jgi:hypothetical protein
MGRSGIAPGKLGALPCAASHMRRHANTSELRALNLLFRFQDLAAAIFSGLEIDVMGTPQFAGFLVLDIGWRDKRISGPSVAAFHARYFSLRDCHCRMLQLLKCKTAHASRRQAEMHADQWSFS